MQLVTMPQASNTMEEGTVVRWLKRPGEAVAQGEILLEIETDKATVEVEAPASGLLREVLAGEGAIVAIHAPIAIIAEAGEAIDGLLAEARAQLGGAAASAPAPAPAAPAAVPAPAAPATPAAPAAPALVAGVTPIVMPQAGNSMEEGTIVKWLVAPGDKISVGQVICEIETDKATVEVEATDAGRLARLVAKPGDIIPVKQPIALLAENDADAEAWLASSGKGAAATAVPASPVAAPAAAPAASAPATAPAAKTETGRVKASPAARKIATERGIDLAAVGAGSGPGGRILSKDVPAAAPVFVAPAAPAAGGLGRPLTGMRRAIARNLSLSKQTIPHWYLTVTVDAGPMLKLHKSGPGKAPFTINDILVAGMAKVAMELPAFRGRYENERIVDYPTANIGVAVGTDDALVVPVVLAANELSLRQLGATTRRMVAEARAGKIQNAGQGCMTISNLGMFGIDDFIAIINPPETAIIAVGGIRENVIVKDGAIRAGKTITLTISSDHRVIDGTMAARFMARLREVLEAPEQLLGAEK